MSICLNILLFCAYVHISSSFGAVNDNNAKVAHRSKIVPKAMKSSTPQEPPKNPFKTTIVHVNPKLTHHFSNSVRHRTKVQTPSPNLPFVTRANSRRNSQHIDRRKSNSSIRLNRQSKESREKRSSLRIRADNPKNGSANVPNNDQENTGKHAYSGQKRMREVSERKQLPTISTKRLSPKRIRMTDAENGSNLLQTDERDILKINNLTSTDSSYSSTTKQEVTRQLNQLNFINTSSEKHQQELQRIVQRSRQPPTIKEQGEIERRKLDEQLRRALEEEKRREEQQRQRAEAEYKQQRQESAEKKQINKENEKKKRRLREKFMTLFNNFLEDEVDMAFGKLKNKDSGRSALNLMHERFAIDLLDQMNVGIPLISDHIYEATKLEIPYDPSLRTKYKFVKKLGSGSFGDAELAREDILDVNGKLLASFYAVVKNIPKVNPNHIIHEVRALRALKKMNSIFTTKILFAYQDNDYVHIAMEYVECGDLEHIMRRVRKTITPDFENKLRYVAASLIIALLEIHRAGILHNDLFPANMLMDKHGRIKVSDFGLSRARDSPAHSGAMAVMPPENTKKISPSYTTVSEYFSLGVSLYRLAMGAYYFGINYNEVIMKQSQFHHVLGIHIIERNLITTGMSKEGADFISHLFHPDPKVRAKFIPVIAAHDWFKHFDFQALNDGTMVSPFYNFAKNCGIQNVDSDS